jgi:hypothetical protein
MFNLTISGAQVDAWLVRCKLPVKTRRVYRWDDIWGFVTDSGLQSVKRNFLADTTDGTTHYNLESQSLVDASVPLLCDDIWDEEYVEHTRGTCNGLLTVTGTLKDIQMWCKTAHIVVPENLWMGIKDTIISKPDDVQVKKPEQSKQFQGHNGRYPQSRPQNRPLHNDGANRGRPFVHRPNRGGPPRAVVEHV